MDYRDAYEQVFGLAQKMFRVVVAMTVNTVSAGVIGFTAGWVSAGGKVDGTIAVLRTLGVALGVVSVLMMVLYGRARTIPKERLDRATSWATIAALPVAVVAIIVAVLVD